MPLRALFNIFKVKNAPLFVKEEAVRALNWSNSLIALDYLESCLYSSDIMLIQEIVCVLGRQELIELKSYATKILIDFLNSDTEINHQSGIKQLVATSLGELGDSKALIYLEKLTDDDNSKVRLYANAAIKKITHSKP